MKKIILFLFFATSCLLSIESLQAMSYKEKEDLNEKMRNAAYSKNLVEFQECLKKGADINSKSFSGGTALTDAAWKQDLQMVEYLIENGADINVPGQFNCTALRIAVGNLNLKMVKYLVEHGANINKGDEEATPLLLAIRIVNKLYEKLEIIKYLIEHGAYLLLNDNGKTTLEAAEGYNEGHDNEYEDFVDYIQLVIDYQKARKNKKVADFLKTITAEQADDIIKIALTKNYEPDLYKFIISNPDKYSWLALLTLAEKLDEGASVELFLKLMNITGTEALYIIGLTNNYEQKVSEYKQNLIEQLKQLYATAKTNQHEKFVRAVLEYKEKLLPEKKIIQPTKKRKIE